MCIRDRRSAGPSRAVQRPLLEGGSYTRYSEASYDSGRSEDLASDYDSESACLSDSSELSSSLSSPNSSPYSFTKGKGHRKPADFVKVYFNLDLFQGEEVRTRGGSADALISHFEEQLNVMKSKRPVISIAGYDKPHHASKTVFQRSKSELLGCWLKS